MTSQSLNANYVAPLLPNTNQPNENPSRISHSSTTSSNPNTTGSLYGWLRPSVSGPPPTARCAHATDACGVGKLFIFGGWNGSKMLNDLFVFHSDPMTWSKPVTTGTVPNLRAGHTMNGVGTKLFILGGGDGNHYLNDLHILDTETMEWKQAYVTGSSPAARSRHSATLVGTQLFVFGGGDDSRVYNDVYVLETEKMSWSRPIIKGTPPSARWGHTCSCLGDGRLLVFGGHDGNKMLNDIHILDSNNMTWSQLNLPTKIQDGQMHVLPQPRAGHTITLVGKKLVLFGGGDGSNILNDIWVFDPTSMIWTPLLVSGSPPSARCAHTSSLLDGKLVIFGGGDGSRRFKDLYVLDIENILKNEELKKVKFKKPKNRNKESPKSPEKKDIGSWLNNLGMKRYVDKFISQEIDMDTLPLLTESHLEQLGIPTMGARLRILAAIKELKLSDNEEKNEKNPSSNNISNSNNTSTANSKDIDLVELTNSLKESIQSLTSSTNRLSEILAHNYMNPPPIHVPHTNGYPPIIYTQQPLPPPFPPKLLQQISNPMPLKKNGFHNHQANDRESLNGSKS